MAEIYCQRAHQKCKYAELNYKPLGMKTTGCSLMPEYSNIYTHPGCVFEDAESIIPLAKIEENFSSVNAIPFEIDPPSGILMVMWVLYKEFLTLCIVSDRRLERHELALIDSEGRIYNRHGLRNLYNPNDDSLIYITEEGTDAWESILESDMQKLLLYGKYEGHLFTSPDIMHELP